MTEAHIINSAIDVPALVQRYKDLTARRDDLQAEIDAILATARDLGLGKHATDHGTVAVGPNRRFNAELAETVLTGINPALVTACQSTVLDSKKVKATVPPAVYEQCMKDAPNLKVTIS